MKRIAVAALALMIAGCGLRQPLQPASGDTMPIAPPMARAPLTTDQLLAVPIEARPMRVDEALTRSERRAEDRFALPPPELATEAEPVPVEAVEPVSADGADPDQPE